MQENRFGGLDAARQVLLLLPFLRNDPGKPD